MLYPLISSQLVSCVVHKQEDGVSFWVHFVTIWQCDSEQRPHKVSFHVKKEESVHVIPMLTQKLEARGVSPFSVSSALSCLLQTYQVPLFFCNASVSYSIFFPQSLRFQNKFLPHALTCCWSSCWTHVTVTTVQTVFSLFFSIRVSSFSLLADMVFGSQISVNWLLGCHSILIGLTLVKYWEIFNSFEDIFPCPYSCTPLEI